jgi:hypothetical protein
LGIPIAESIKRLVGPLIVDEPLARLSPTSLPPIAACRLRGVWQASGQPPLLPSSPAAHLGTIIHRLFEEAGQGAFSDKTEPSGAEARWHELVAEKEQAMSAQPLERRFVPLQQHIPKFEVLRIRTLARVAELSAGVQGREAGPAGADGTPYGPELWVESTDGLIAGKIDRALPGPEGPILQDYKSGAIFSLGHGDQQELKPEYALQLRLYAALYHEQTGEWPSRLQLVPLIGEPRDVSFSAAECVKLLDDARNTLERINEDIARCGNDADALESLLASPSSEACRYCSYRPACSKYLALDVPREDPWPADVWGQLAALVRLGNGTLMLELDIRGESLFFVRGLADPVIDEAGLDLASKNIPVGIFNAKRTRSQRAFESGPQTSVVRGEATPVGNA